MSAVHVPHCPHCHSEARHPSEALGRWFGSGLGWWFGQDCTVCGKRFDTRLRHDGLFDVRAAGVNGKNAVQCPHCNFTPIGPRMAQLLPQIPRDRYTAVTCGGCGRHFETQRIADQLFDSRAVAMMADGREAL